MVIVWSAPFGTAALPGVTAILYGAAASTLCDTRSIADKACRRNAGPSSTTSTAAATMAPNTAPLIRSGLFSTRRVVSARQQTSIACVDQLLHQRG